MQRAANISLVLTDFSSLERFAELGRCFSHAGLYQVIGHRLIGGFDTNRTLGDFAGRLASVADQAHSIHQFDIVEHVGRLLLNLSLSHQLESVGHYYRALSINQGGSGDTPRAVSLFEQVADEAPMRYRARAMLALGSKSLRLGDQRTAMSFYREVMQIVTRRSVLDPMTFYSASRMTAVIRSMDGDHQGALRDLEVLFPLAKMASLQQPYAYYDYLSTLAVELMEAGRLEEARNASRIALASPFAPAYPEWRETREEIELRGRRASRSVVAFYQENAEATSSAAGPEGGKLVHLPAPERDDSPRAIELSPKIQPARVLSMQEWKKKMPEKSNDDPQVKHTEEQIREMTTSQRLVRIMNLISNEMSDDELGKVLSFLEQIALEKKGKS
jgi:tetratricopeptide (TPR) repeat protein